ncbi:unnamed protein product [Rotaria sordida]|uniref:Uncharacterized protein n=1 Tax=Rotaria sordida TaxID=392033 RepID=A0A814FZ91_9BILA|nr:unnamed protein product [Rotaria sordida]CAF1157786.1 unnamed protein product [Rotaria sordida]
MEDSRHSIANPGIKSPNRSSDEVTKNLNVVKLGNDENVKVSRIQLAAKQRINSFDGELKTPLMQKAIEKMYSRLHNSRIEGSGIRVTRLHSKPSTLNYQSSINNPSPSIIGTTIHLDNHDGIKPLSNVSTVDKEKSSLQSVRRDMKISEHRSSEMETIEMSRINSISKPINAEAARKSSTSSSVVRVERLKATNKKMKSKNLKPVVEETGN